MWLHKYDTLPLRSSILDWREWMINVKEQWDSLNGNEMVVHHKESSIDTCD